MNCPKCNTRLSTVNSRRTPDNCTRRQLKCPRCLSRYKTLETIIDGDADSMDSAVRGVISRIAEQSIIKGAYASAVTGGIYLTEQEAIRDSIAELERIYNEQ